MMKTERKVPEHVELRDENGSHRSAANGGTIDCELSAIILEHGANPSRMMKKWFVRAKVRGRHAAVLIPFMLKAKLALPVRQVYVHGDELYRIEADGRVSEKLL